MKYSFLIKKSKRLLSATDLQKFANTHTISVLAILFWGKFALLYTSANK
jgi:hypothetical protein